MRNPVIEVQGLVNRFGSQVVHDGLDMQVMQHEVFGIVGGSGTGKSVLLRSILGLQRPQAGSVRIEGHDITRASEAQLRPIKARYGVAFQSGALYSGLTVLQNVQLPMLEYLDLEAAVLDELARLKIGLVGLNADAAEKYPAELSGGMVKRAAIARALALDPGLLFLDEPTSGLDPVSAAAFDELMLFLQKELKLTVIMITHDLDSIFRTCNRVGVIVDRHMESDTVERIVDHPNPWIREYFHGERARGALDHAARELRRVLAGGICRQAHQTDLEQRECIQHHFLEIEVLHHGQLHVLQHRQARVQCPLLECHPVAHLDRAHLRLAHLRDVVALDAHRAGLRTLQPEDGAQQHRLACARPADDTKHLVLEDLHVETVVNHLAAEAVHEPAHLEHRVPHQMSNFMNSTANNASARITRKIACTTATVTRRPSSRAEPRTSMPR